MQIYLIYIYHIRGADLIITGTDIRYPTMRLGKLQTGNGTTWLLDRTSYSRVMLVSPQAEILVSSACGAVSVPRKNFGFPLVAALTRSSRCVSRLSTGRQYICGRIPPCYARTFVTNVTCLWQENGESTMTAVTMNASGNGWLQL